MNRSNLLAILSIVSVAFLIVALLAFENSIFVSQSQLNVNDAANQVNSAIADATNAANQVNSALGQANTAADGKPNTAADGNPNTAADGKPNTAADGKPNTAADGKPNTAADGKPNTAADGKPNVSNENKPAAPVVKPPPITEWRTYEYHKNLACSRECELVGGTVCGTVLKKTCCLSNTCVNYACQADSVKNLQSSIVYWLFREVREPTTCVDSGYDDESKYCAAKKADYDKKFGNDVVKMEVYKKLCPEEVVPVVPAKIKRSHKKKN